MYIVNLNRNIRVQYSKFHFFLIVRFNEKFLELPFHYPEI